MVYGPNRTSGDARRPAPRDPARQPPHGDLLRGRGLLANGRPFALKNARRAFFRPCVPGHTRAYLALMAESCGRLGVEIWAYCLMPFRAHGGQRNRVRGEYQPVKGDDTNDHP